MSLSGLIQVSIADDETVLGYISTGGLLGCKSLLNIFQDISLTDSLSLFLDYFSYNVLANAAIFTVPYVYGLSPLGTLSLLRSYPFSWCFLLLSLSFIGRLEVMSTSD